MNLYSIRTILVPVDMSEAALNAIETAVSLAKKFSAKLYLLYVSELIPGSEEAGSETVSAAQVNADVLSAIASAINHHHKIMPQVLEAEGNVVEAILQTGAQLQTDLIVMGSHGASGYRDGFIGGTAYHTIKFSHCPVLTIPAGQKVDSFKKILLPTRPVSNDLSYFELVNDLLPAKAKIEVLGFANRTEKETQLLEHFVAGIQQQTGGKGAITNACRGPLSHIPETVLQQLASSKPDLLIITSVLDSVVKPYYIGPYAQKIIHLAKVPILTIKKVAVPAYA